MSTTGWKSRDFQPRERLHGRQSNWALPQLSPDEHQQLGPHAKQPIPSDTDAHIVEFGVGGRRQVHQPLALHPGHAIASGTSPNTGAPQSSTPAAAETGQPNQPQVAIAKTSHWLSPLVVPDMRDRSLQTTTTRANTTAIDTNTATAKFATQADNLPNPSSHQNTRKQTGADGSHVPAQNPPSMPAHTSSGGDGTSASTGALATSDQTDFKRSKQESKLSENSKPSTSEELSQPHKKPSSDPTPPDGPGHLRHRQHDRTNRYADSPQPTSDSVKQQASSQTIVPPAQPGAEWVPHSTVSAGRAPCLEASTFDSQTGQVGHGFNNSAPTTHHTYSQHLNSQQPPGYGGVHDVSGDFHILYAPSYGHLNSLSYGSAAQLFANSMEASRHGPSRLRQSSHLSRQHAPVPASATPAVARRPKSTDPAGVVMDYKAPPSAAAIPTRESSASKGRRQQYSARYRSPYSQSLSQSHSRSQSSQSKTVPSGAGRADTSATRLLTEGGRHIVHHDSLLPGKAQTEAGSDEMSLRPWPAAALAPAFQLRRWSGVFREAAVEREFQRWLWLRRKASLRYHYIGFVIICCVMMVGSRLAEAEVYNTGIFWIQIGLMAFVCLLPGIFLACLRRGCMGWARGIQTWIWDCMMGVMLVGMFIATAQIVTFTCPDGIRDTTVPMCRAIYYEVVPWFPVTMSLLVPLAFGVTVFMNWQIAALSTGCLAVLGIATVQSLVAGSHLVLYFIACSTVCACIEALRRLGIEQRTTFALSMQSQGTSPGPWAAQAMMKGPATGAGGGGVHSDVSHKQQNTILVRRNAALRGGEYRWAVW